MGRLGTLLREKKGKPPKGGRPISAAHTSVVKLTGYAMKNVASSNPCEREARDIRLFVLHSFTKTN